jgi:hypothetical protein
MSTGMAVVNSGHRRDHRPHRLALAENLRIPIASRSDAARDDAACDGRGQRPGDPGHHRGPPERLLQKSHLAAGHRVRGLADERETADKENRQRRALEAQQSRGRGAAHARQPNVDHRGVRPHRLANE